MRLFKYLRMRQIINIFKKIFTKPIPSNTFIQTSKVNTNINPLGRWNVNNSDEIINIKIDLANEDNCGPCGQYIIAQNTTRS